MPEFGQYKSQKRVRGLSRLLAACLLAGTVIGISPPAGAAVTFTVNSTNDVNDTQCDPTHCSLREAIIASNAAAGTDTINFNIAGTGPHTIAPTAALPTITSPVVVDGTSEPDYQVGVPVVEVTGINRTNTQFWTGFHITAGSSTIKGLIINGFFRGIQSQTNGGNTIAGNFLGTNASGTTALNNQGPNLDIFTSNNMIGGTTTADRNVLAAGNDGVVLQSTANGNSVLNNYIGTAKDGTTKLANGRSVAVFGDNNIIGAPTDGNVIVGGIDQGSGGVEIGSAEANNNTVAGNFIGVDATGDAPIGNAGAGVRVWGAGNTIGGTAEGAGNVISRNGTAGSSPGGIQILAANTTVQGNIIGLDASGQDALGNVGPGIFVTTTGNLIGGAAAGAGNVISANSATGGYQANGIDLSGSNATNNTVQGNKIGTDITGTLDRGNSHRGIQMNSAPGNTIGGSGAGEGNLISGNEWEGVSVSSASGNTIQGNKIGTNAAGTAALPNSTFGVVIGGPNNQIGGTAAGAGNLISGHTAAPGLTLTAGGNTVQGNKIGTDVSGQSAIPNQAGIEGLFGSNNSFGGTADGAGNIIAFNAQFGIRASGTGNKILRNSIHSNGSSSNFWRGIHLDNNVPPNDAGDVDTGNNNLQNFPVINSIGIVSGNLTVGASLSSTPDTDYRVEFFRNAQCNPSGHGEGQTFIGFMDVRTGANGAASFGFDASNKLTPGDLVTATATDPAGNTSEFSACKRYNRPPVLASIGNRNGAEGSFLTFQISATDPDGDAPLTYSASNLPSGAAFDQNTRTFSWFPSHSQAGNYEDVRFEVSDGKGGTDFEDIDITISNTNRAPVLAPVGNKEVAEGSELNFQLSAVDPDGDAVTYSAQNLPAGTPVLVPENGIFSWTPDYNEAGQYEVTFVASDGSLTDSETLTITVTDTDVDAPVVNMDAPSTPFTTKKGFNVSWNATDPGSGVASYDVAYKSAAYGALLGAKTVWQTDTTATSASFVGKAGHSYCFSARAIDANGNESDYTPDLCTAVPLDDVALKKTSEWERKAGKGYYLKTFSVAKEKGATLSLAGVKADQLALVATKCPKCGTVKVFLGKTQLKKINLASPTLMKKQVLPVKTFDSTMTGTVKIVVSSDDKSVMIEGLGIAKTGA